MSAAKVLHIPPPELKVVSTPFDSVPYGRSLEVNILGTGTKACSFNCAYCELGQTMVRLSRLKEEILLPTTEEISVAAVSAFQTIHLVGPSMESLLLSGNGEPTLHPEFPEIARALLAARDLWLAGKKFRVLTNGAALDNRKVIDALNLFDERIVKIDAGNEKAFKAVTSPLSRANLAKILTGVRKLTDFTIQSTFFKGNVDNTSPTDIDDWMEVMAILQPRAVHIKGLKTKTRADGLIACDEDTLYAIASRLERKAHIRAMVIF